MDRYLSELTIPRASMLSPLQGDCTTTLMTRPLSSNTFYTGVIKKKKKFHPSIAFMFYVLMCEENVWLRAKLGYKTTSGCFHSACLPTRPETWTGTEVLFNTPRLLFRIEGTSQVKITINQLIVILRPFTINVQKDFLWLFMAKI